MKCFSVLASILLFTGCGNFNFSNEKNRVSTSDLEEATSGLQLTIKNSLPVDVVNGHMIRPRLNVFFCSPMSGEEISNLKTDDRCVRLTGVVENGATETFLVSREDLSRILQQSQGQAAFEFMDNYQLTMVPWHCSYPNHIVAFGSNYYQKQVWSVEVTRRYLASYECTIERR